MAGKITDYTPMTTLTDGDLFDISDFDEVSAYASKSLTWALLKTNIESEITFENFATTDLTLTGNRVHDLGVNDLTLGSTGDANLLKLETTNDRVGIGTATPSEKFNVVGITRLDGATGINENPSNSVSLTIKGLVSPTSSNFQIQSYNNSAASNSAFDVNGLGGVSMGAFNTIASNNRLHILGITGASATDLVVVARRSTTAQGFALQENGNFGIGTEAPTNKLEVIGNTDSTTYSVNGTAGANFSGAVTNITVVDGIVTAAS